MTTLSTSSGPLTADAWQDPETSKLCIRVTASKEFRGFYRMAADEALLLYNILGLALYGPKAS